MNRDIRKITDGAMMAAIIAVMLLINRQTAGLLEVSFLWILPLPMVFYGAKYGWKDSGVLFIAIILLTIIIGTPQTLFYVVSEMLIGIVYGCGIYDRTPSRKLVIRTMILAVVADILSMLVFASFFGYDLQAEITEYEKILNTAFEQTGTQLAGTMDLTSMLKTVVVVSVIFNGIFEGFITHVLSRMMLKRLRIYVQPMNPISDYYPPKWSGYIGILGLVAFYYSSYHTFENEMIQSILQGFGIAGIFYLVIFGCIAVMILLKTRYGMKGFSVVIVLFLCILVSIGMAIVGYFYITTDLHDRLIQGDNSHAFKDGKN